MSLLSFPSAGVSFYHNSTPFSKLFGEKSTDRHRMCNNLTRSDKMASWGLLGTSWGILGPLVGFLWPPEASSGAS